MGITRHARVYFFHMLWIVLSISNFLNHTNTSKAFRFMPYFWIAFGSAFAISLVGMLVKKFYLEVKGDKLYINNDFFQTKKIDLASVEKVVSRPGIFKSAYFLLKDQRRITFTENYVGHTALQNFLNQLNIPLE
jgi:hypothetical protein